MKSVAKQPQNLCIISVRPLQVIPLFLVIPPVWKIWIQVYKDY